MELRGICHIGECQRVVLWTPRWAGMGCAVGNKGEGVLGSAAGSHRHGFCAVGNKGEENG